MKNIILVLSVAVVVLAPTRARAQQAAASQCFTEREFRTASTAFGIEIAGSIMSPRGRPRSAILMITGSGPHTREQRISDSPMFTMIAEHLARRGVLVARTDARGFGGSTGPADDEAYTLADRAEDNRAVLAYLRGLREFTGRRFGLLGHSEGAMIASLIAAHDRRVGFEVLLAPSTIKGDDVFADQLEDSLVHRGASPATAAAVRVQAFRFARLAAAGGGRGAEFSAIAHDFLAAHGVNDERNTPHFAEGLLSGYLDSVNWRYFINYDPQVDLVRLRQPVIAIFAGVDRNVRTARHRPALIEALRQAHNRDLSVVTLEDQDHFFLEHDGHRLDTHVPGEMQVADELFSALDSELQRRHWLNAEACAD